MNIRQINAKPQDDLFNIHLAGPIKKQASLIRMVSITPQENSRYLYHIKHLGRLITTGFTTMMLLLSIDVAAKNTLENAVSEVQKRQKQNQEYSISATKMNFEPAPNTVGKNSEKHTTSAASSKQAAQGYLSIHKFVKLTQQKNFASLQHDQQLSEQTLRRKLAEQYFIPTIEFSTKVSKEDKNYFDDHIIDNHTTDLNAKASINWQLPSGAKLATSYQHQNITIEGLSSAGIAETSQINSTTNVSIEQPILGGLWNNLSHIPQTKAKHQWQYYQTEAQLLALRGQRDALVGYLEFQTQVDLTKFLATATQYAKFRTQAVTELFQEGLAVQAASLQAHLELHQRQAALTKAEGELELIQKRLAAKIDTDSTIFLQPLPNINHLLTCIQIDTSAPMSINEHPELRLSTLQRLIKHKDYESRKFDIWPQVSLFYKYNHVVAELTQNTTEDRWGMRATFKPFNTAGQLSIAQLRTAWFNAGHDEVAKRKQLQQQLDLKINTQTILNQQLALAKQGVLLAHQAFQHTKERYQNGASNLLDIRKSQDELIHLQKNQLNASKAVLNNLFDLYLNQGKPVPINMCGNEGLI